MSKYIKTIPLARVERIAVVFGEGRSLAQVKAATGCDCILNGGLYDFTTGKPVAHLKVEGTVCAKEDWGAWGYAWDAGADIQMLPVPHETAAKANYITCLPLLTPWDGVDAPLTYPPALGGKRGRTALALTGEGLVLYCSGDGTADGATPEELRAQLYARGAKTALMLDSGGSSQCDLGGGQVIPSARRVNNYICVWVKKKAQTPDKEEDTMSDRPIVCLDPGHGPGTVNGSPDGSYKEREFTWDMYQRVRPLLEGRGIRVIVTRREDDKPSLTARAKVSNDAGAHLFISLHSNANGSGGWNGAYGLMIYTSVAGDSAGRNKAAKAILARMTQAGVALHGSGLDHNPQYTVLTATTAPACLIEYGFHTNREDVELLKDAAHREKLAKATVDGICDYLGVAVENEDKEEGSQGGAGEPSSWAAEAWARAVAKGVFDDTDPQGTVTREMLAVVLERWGGQN